MNLNLARAPFTNTRPVVRVTALLWIAGAVLAAIVVLLYWDSLFGLEARARELSELEAAIEAERRAIAEASSRLEALDLAAQNAQAAYLTEQIRGRRFPWSQLFEDLGEVTPRRVRFFSLSPEVGEERDTGRSRDWRRDWRSAARGSERVRLKMSGGAANDEAMLELLDNLFASPDFEDPSLPRESRESDGSLRFELGVEYLPEPGSVPRVQVVELEPEPLQRQAGTAEASERPAGGVRADTGGSVTVGSTPATSGESVSDRNGRSADREPDRRDASERGGGRTASQPVRMKPTASAPGITGGDGGSR